MQPFNPCPLSHLNFFLTAGPNASKLKNKATFEMDRN